MECFTKKIIFCKTLYLRCLTWSWIYLWISQVVLLWFSEGYSGLLDICQTDYGIHSQLRIFPLIRSHAWKYNIHVNKGYQRSKKNDNYSIWCFWSFFHFLHSNAPDNKCYKQKRDVLFFTRIKLVARVLAYAHVIARIKWKRLYLMSILMICK